MERNAKVGNDEEARKKDIPIVQVRVGARVASLSGRAASCGACVRWATEGTSTGAHELPACLHLPACPPASLLLPVQLNPGGVLNHKYTGGRAACACVGPLVMYWRDLPCAAPCRPADRVLLPLRAPAAGEAAVRASGLAYSVLRPTGLTNESEPGDFLLEAGQGGCGACVCVCVWLEGSGG